MLRKAPLGTLMAVILLLAVISMAEDNKAELNTSDLFANRFKKGEIRGTGHLFRIIVDCDKERLQNVSDALSNDETEVVEYDFTFHVNTKDQAKAWIEDVKMDQAVKKCIIDRYYKEVRFFTGPWVPEIMPNHISFPAILVKGKQPMVSVTPIFFVGPE